MIVQSPHIFEGELIPRKHAFGGLGCNGENVVPLLSWRDAPAGTQSFALTVYDPDAPTGSGWWHWIVYNIPSGTRSNDGLTHSPNRRELPGGVLQALNDFGTYNYCGPCPPEGHPPHRYRFALHALKVPAIEVPDSATSATVRFLIHTNTLTNAAITARFAR